MWLIGRSRADTLIIAIDGIHISHSSLLTKKEGRTKAKVTSQKI